MAKSYSYYDDWKSEIFHWPKCGWKGTFDEGSTEMHSELMDMSCPECNWPDAPMLAIVSYVTTQESRDNWDKLSEDEQKEIEVIESLQSEFENKKLRETTPLPRIKATSFVLHWDYRDSGPKQETVIRFGEEIIFTEPATYEAYERYIEVARILKTATVRHSMI